MRKLCLILAAALTGCSLQQLPAPAPGSASNSIAGPATYSHHQTFRYVGKPQQFTVPAGVKRISVVAIGGRGDGSPASYGGRVTAVIPVLGGETLTIRVGGNGRRTPGGFNGGGKGGFFGFSNNKYNGYGGGGASDIRENGDLLTDRVLVAGGGGGQGGYDDVSGSSDYGLGGKGGALFGGTGGAGYPKSGTQCSESIACGGGGGTQKAGGAGGVHGRGSCRANNGGYGALGLGGRGAKLKGTTTSNECGGLGGGGGGGYYGGGGGGQGSVESSTDVAGGGGGGGGSSYVERKATNVHMWQGWDKNEYGLIVFSW